MNLFTLLSALVYFLYPSVFVFLSLTNMQQIVLKKEKEIVQDKAINTEHTH